MKRWVIDSCSHSWKISRCEKMEGVDMKYVNIGQDFAHGLQKDNYWEDARTIWPRWQMHLIASMLHYLSFAVAVAAVSVTPHRLIRIISSCILILSSRAKIMRRRTWPGCYRRILATWCSAIIRVLYTDLVITQCQWQWLNKLIGQVDGL